MMGCPGINEQTKQEAINRGIPVIPVPQDAQQHPGIGCMDCYAIDEQWYQPQDANGSRHQSHHFKASLSWEIKKQ